MFECTGTSEGLYPPVVGSDPMVYLKPMTDVLSADYIGWQKSANFCMSHDRFYRPILPAINLAVELGSNFAEKIGR